MAFEVVARRRGHGAKGAAESRCGDLGRRESRGQLDSGGSQSPECAGSKHAESSTSRGHGYQQFLDHLLPFSSAPGPKTVSLTTDVRGAQLGFFFGLA